jgi:hypothetical protein
MCSCIAICQKGKSTTILTGDAGGMIAWAVAEAPARHDDERQGIIA